LYAQDWRRAEPVKRWQSRVAPGTFPTFYSLLWRFLAHIQKSPEEAVAWAKSQDPLDVLDVIQSYVLQLPAHLRYNELYGFGDDVRVDCLRT
jgi:hypothetical protein